MGGHGLCQRLREDVEIGSPDGIIPTDAHGFSRGGVDVQIAPLQILDANNVVGGFQEQAKPFFRFSFQLSLFLLQLHEVPQKAGTAMVNGAYLQRLGADHPFSHRLGAGQFDEEVEVRDLIEFLKVCRRKDPQTVGALYPRGFRIGVCDTQDPHV